MISKKAAYIKIPEANVHGFSNKINECFKDVAYDKPYYLKGMLYVPKGKIEVRMGYDADDFIKNNVTIIAQRYVSVTRVPRIVKRLYQKMNHD